MNYFAHDDKSHWSKKERNMFDHLISQRRLLPVFEGRTMPGIQPLEAVLEYGAVRGDLERLKSTTIFSLNEIRGRLETLEDPSYHEVEGDCYWCEEPIWRGSRDGTWVHHSTQRPQCEPSGRRARPK